MELRGGEDSIYDEDDFKVIKRLGYGDMGTVFLAVLRETGQPFAIKVMSKEVVRERNNGYRAERELDILSSLDHPFLTRLLTRFESKKFVFLVTEYCPGGDMNILRQRQPERKFTDSAARFYAAEVVLAIQHLHRVGILYRDLKPENVLIQEDGHIMLTDFDLSVKLPSRNPNNIAPSTEVKCSSRMIRSSSKSSSRRMFMCANPMSVDVVCGAIDVKSSSQRVTKSKIFPSEERVRRSNRKGGGGQQQQQQQVSEVRRSQSFVGTEEYVAPEMILGSGHSKALDWWTFGIFLYEMVYGTTPFKGRTRRETFNNILTRQPSFPGGQTLASDLISKLLVKEPRKRLNAEEIQRHAFFEGVEWEYLQYVARPPWVPLPLVAEEYEEVAIEELLKQTTSVKAAGEQQQKEQVTATTPVMRRTESEVTDGTSDVRSSSLSSSITDDFSDLELAGGGGGGGGVSAPGARVRADTYALF